MLSVFLFRLSVWTLPGGQICQPPWERKQGDRDRDRDRDIDRDRQICHPPSKTR